MINGISKVKALPTNSCMCTAAQCGTNPPRSLPRLFAMFAACARIMGPDLTIISYSSLHWQTVDHPYPWTPDIR